MDSETSVNEKGGNYDVVVEILVPGNEETSRKNDDDLQGNSVSESNGESSNVELTRMHMNLFTSTSTPAQPIIPTPTPTPTPTPDPSAKPPIGLAIPQKSIYSKPKSRIAEPPYPKSSKPAEESVKTAPEKSPDMSASNLASTSLKANRNTSAPSTPKTPLMASIGGVDDNDDDDDEDEVYKTENRKADKVRRGKKMDVLTIIEWIAFVCIMVILIVSLTVNKLKGVHVWSLELWKWCLFVLVIFCGRLLTEWLSNILAFLIEKNFLLKKKVLYFLFALKKSVRVVIWLALILLAWVLLINRGVKRSEETAKILNRISRGIVSTLVGAVLWMVKTFLIKLVASTFHVRTFFDRIQESLFHQYILQALSGTPMDDGNDSAKISCQLSNSAKTGKQEKEGEVIDVDKLYKMKREKVSAWTMGGLIRVISKSGLPTLSDVLDENVEEAWGEKKEITSEIEARDAANRIFSKVAKHGHKYIDEDDLLRFMPNDKVDNALPLFEGAAESRRIKKSSFRNWVVKVYNERKCLAASLNDAKTAIEELNRIASGLVLVVIVILWLLLMEITTTSVLVFIASQLLLVVFMFGNTAKMVFEAIIFIFVVHPFDVGDHCVIDGVQMVVDEMNILTTIFLKSDNEKVYYPNAVLATRTISNFNRSPEMMGDSVEFAVDLSTSVESIAALKAKIKSYLESKPQHWSPSHSVQIKEIVDAHKLQMVLYVTHTMNFQNSGEMGNRRSDLVFELKKILEELGIE